MKELINTWKINMKPKYSIWFNGNNYENGGICYSGREPAIFDSIEAAIEHRNTLMSNTGATVDSFTLIKIVEV